MPGNSLRSSRNRHGGRRAMSEINVVPYIDVMLVLLVIFMTTAAFVPTGVVDVPRAGKANNNPTAYIEVQLAKEGKLRIEPRNMGKISAQAVAAADLGAQIQRLRGTNNDIPVVIAADGAIAYDKVMALLKQMQDQGISKVSLLVKR